jgi:hypothetical protein
MEQDGAEVISCAQDSMAMVSEKEIWESARRLIDRHGAEAAARAAAKADELASEGNFDGQRTWVRIRKAIEWLRDEGARDPSQAEH